MLRALLLTAAALALAAPASAHADELFTVAGGGSAEPHIGLPATLAELPPDVAVAALPAGGFLVGADSRVWRVDAQGTLRLAAGSGRLGFTGDGGPATLAEIDVDDLAVLPGGGFLILDENDQRVRMVDANGIITTVAGGGTSTASGIPATQAALDVPNHLAVLPGGGFVIGDDFDLVREVGPDGLIRTIAGGGEDEDVHGQPATAVDLDVSDVAAEPDGGVLVAESYSGRVDRIAPDGSVRVALQSSRHAGIEPSDIATLPGGGFAIFDDGDVARRIWRVSPGGALHLVAGGGPFARTAPPGLAQLVDGGPATSFELPEAATLAALPDGGLLYAYERDDLDEFNDLVAYVAPAQPGMLAVGIRRDADRVFGHGRRATVHVALTEPAAVTVAVGRHTLRRELPAGVTAVRLPARLPLEPDLVTVTATDAAGRQAIKRARVFPEGVLPLKVAKLVAGALIRHSEAGECDRIDGARVDCRAEIEPVGCRDVSVSYVRGRIRWGTYPCDHPPATEPRGRPLRRRDWRCGQAVCPPPKLFGRVGEAALIPSD
jgi:hypothetical protein